MSQTKPPAFVALIARRLQDAHDARVEASLSALMESDPDAPIPYVLTEPDDGSEPACLACGCCPAGVGHFGWYCPACADLPHGQAHTDGPR
jgi:hypothetical protein